MSKYALGLAAAGMPGLASSQSFAALSAADKAFAMKAASGGMAEVQMGQLAQQNATLPQVKQFGQKMATDHAQANQELQQIAQRENLQLPAQPNSKDMAGARQLGNLRGSAFDGAYSRDMVRDHQQDVADFQKEAQSGQNPALKAFARKYLPTLRQHLQMAQALASR